MKFVQFSDVHLDSTISGALNLPSQKRETLQRELRTAVRRACDLAIKHSADLILIPGDLFDYESLDEETSSFLVQTFAEVGPIKIFIAPGNHDSLRPRNPYLDITGLGWPKNVHIFTSQEFQTVYLSDVGCSVTGIAHAHRGITDRLSTLAERMNISERANISILLLHGSRDGYRPSEKENVLPFSDDELLALGFTYAALGHYHSFAQITDASGRIRAAYSGCIQGRALDETGEKYVLLGCIDSDGKVELERFEVAERRVLAVEVSVTDAKDNEAIFERIRSGIESVSARPQDIVHVSLTGVLSKSVALDISKLESIEDYFHVTVSSSGVEPDYNLEELARKSAASPVKSAFVRRMLELSNQAASPEEKRVVRDAIYYGLQALEGRKLEPRNAD
jgi:DNA repair exonuclease SbcCD nuclease subunit